MPLWLAWEFDQVHSLVYPPAVRLRPGEKGPGVARECYETTEWQFVITN